MNEFTDENEQAFLNVGGAMGVEPNATINTQKEGHLVSEFLKHPVSWLETESLYPNIQAQHWIQRSGLDPGVIQNIWQSM